MTGRRVEIACKDSRLISGRLMHSDGDTLQLAVFDVATSLEKMESIHKSDIVCISTIDLSGWKTAGLVVGITAVVATGVVLALLFIGLSHTQ